MTAIEPLKLSDFRQRVVAGSFPKYSGLSDAINGLRFVQADPIRSPARAQDLILRQRVDGYFAGELESTFPDLQAEEGYLFAYGFMTPEVWQSLRSRPAIKLKKRERQVLDAVNELGEVHPRGLDERFGRKSVQNQWGGKGQETKQILEKLHHHGYLRVSRRQNGIRVYQVPEKLSLKKVSSRDRYRHLALTTAHVFGPTTKRFLVSELRIHNHLLSRRQDRLDALDSMVHVGDLSEVDVSGVTYLCTAQAWESDDVPDRVRVLAPFDPLVRNRERFEQLWNWNYRFEAYVPAAKRERGYYAMPVLWRDRVVGWSNASLVNDRLKVELGYAGKRPREKAFRRCAEKEVASMAEFLGLPNDAWEVAF